MKRAMVLRLDDAMMTALEAAADGARISREGYVRELVAERLGVADPIGSQRPWSPRYGETPVDVRIRRGREQRSPVKKKRSTVRQNVAQLRRGIDKKRKARKAGRA